MLNEYLQQTQRLLNDQAEGRFNHIDLQYYVNAARKRIAADGQCIRFLPPSSGSFASISVAHGGTGYTTPPTVTISPPDAYGVGYVQATATATVAGGAVTGFSITNAGTGYVNPTITLSGGGGSGASASFTLTAFLTTVTNQEVYTFSTVQALLPTGYQYIIAVQSVAVCWGSVKPVLRWSDWSGFQAYYRSLNIQSTNWPSVWAQYAQGVNGSIYLYPIPSQNLQMEWDCYCLPSDLSTDASVEVLPYPWTHAVPYYACSLAMLSVGATELATYFDAQYRLRVKEARAWTSPAMVPDFYEGPF